MKLKHISIALILFFSLGLIMPEAINKNLPKHIVTQSTIQDPLLVVTLMVKDEENVIIDTLKPFVDSNIDTFFIYDTGSTDNTIAVVQKYFQDKKINNYAIVQEPFIDYGASRNKALDLTEKQFPEASFMLMIDAEWYTENVPGLITICKHLKNNTTSTDADCFNIKLKSNRYEFYTPRLIKCKSNIRFTGKIHETIDIPAEKIPRLPENIFFRYMPTQDGIARTQARLKRDKEVLLKEYSQNPNDLRTIYYLAQTYFCLGEDPNAENFYKRYIELDNSGEYTYLSLYTLGMIKHLEFEKNKNQQSWIEGQNYFIKAYELRPWRAEPLVRIAEHYFSTQEWPLCFMFAQQAAELSYPENDILNIDHEIYNYQRYNILAMSSWFVGKFEIGLEATKRALSARPNEVIHKKNLVIYSDAINNKLKKS